MIGYRAAVASCTCFEVAAAEPAFLLPLVRSLACCNAFQGTPGSVSFLTCKCTLAYSAALLKLVSVSRCKGDVLLQMAAREKVRAAVEKGLGLELGLLVEFTGLISWRPGAAIDFHHDANRSGCSVINRCMCRAWHSLGCMICRHS